MSIYSSTTSVVFHLLIGNDNHGDDHGADNLALIDDPQNCASSFIHLLKYTQYIHPLQTDRQILATERQIDKLIHSSIGMRFAYIYTPTSFILPTPIIAAH